MLSLFRGYQIEPRLNRYVMLLGLSGVFAWLYFSFIKKAFVGKIISGEALIVDLVLGLPLVLMLAIVVYASIYWSCKLFIIFLLPHAMIPVPDSDQIVDEVNDEWDDSQENLNEPASKTNIDLDDLDKPK